MAVFNGQVANATTFNQAFVSLTTDNSIAGVKTFTNTTDATALGVGAIISLGGASFAKQLQVGADASIAGAISIGSAAQAIDASTGSITTLGGIGLAKSLYCGEGGTFVGPLVASNLTGTNTGDLTVASFGASPNGAGASVSGQVLQIQPAASGFPGAVSIGTQTFSGVKTFEASVTFADTIGVSGNATFGGALVSVEGQFQTNDPQITVNKTGDQAAANAGVAGVLVEMSDATDAVVGFNSAFTSKFGVGESGSVQEIASISHAQTFTNKVSYDTSNDPFLVEGSFASPGTSDGTSTVAVGSATVVVKWLSSVSGSQTMSANPQFTAGTKIGQHLHVLGASDTNILKLIDGNGLRLNGPCFLNAKQGITLVWNGSDWQELGRVQ